MIIVVEGPDGVGKSTFCEMLRRQAEAQGVHADISHHGPSPRNAFDAYLSEINRHSQASLLLPSVLIMDRFHYGDLVYGTTRRSGIPNLSFDDLNYLNKAIFVGGGQVIILIPSISETLRRLEEKMEDVPPRLADERAMFELLGAVGQKQNPQFVRVIDKVMDWTEADLVARHTVAKMIRNQERSQGGDQDQRHAFGVPDGAPGRKGRFESVAEGTHD